MKDKVKGGSGLILKKERLVTITPNKNQRSRGIAADTTMQSSPDCFNM